MGHVAYWAVFSVFLSIFIFLIVNKKFKFFDYIMFISMVAFAKIIDHMLGIASGLFHYVQLGTITYFYAFFYDIVVYPTVGVIFSKLFPRSTELRALLRYNLSWIAFAVAFEAVIAHPFGIIVYVRWRIFPDSLLFYAFIFPVLSWYKLFLEKKLGHG